MPGAGFKAAARAMAERLQRLANESYHHVQKQVVSSVLQNEVSLRLSNPPPYIQRLAVLRRHHLLRT